MAVLCDSVNVFVDNRARITGSVSRILYGTESVTQTTRGAFSVWDIRILLLKCWMARDPFFLVHRT